MAADGNAVILYRMPGNEGIQGEASKIVGPEPFCEQKKGEKLNILGANTKKNSECLLVRQ